MAVSDVSVVPTAPKDREAPKLVWAMMEPDASSARREFKWMAVRFSTGDHAFLQGWFFIGFFLFVGIQTLTQNYVDSIVLGVLGGEVGCGMLLNILWHYARRPSFPAYSVGRVTAAGNVDSLRDRLEAAFRDINWYVCDRVGSENFEEFIRRVLNESDALPQEDLPRTYTAMTQAITRDLSDLAMGQPRPWSSVNNRLRELREAFTDRYTAKAARAALSAIYIRCSPSYRKAAAVAKQASRIPTAEEHPYLYLTAKYILPPAAVVVAALLQKYI